MNTKYTLVVLTILVIELAFFSSPILAATESSTSAIPILTPPIATSSVAQNPKRTAKGIEVMPALQDITLSGEGEEQKIDITYTNRTEAPISLTMSAVDFKTDESGQVNFVDEQSNYSYSLASFLSLESGSLDLAPNESKIFKATIKNRDDVTPGGHYAAVIAKLTSNSENPGSANIVAAITSLIYLHKTGGEKYSLKLSEFTDPSFFITFSYPVNGGITFRNDGNIHLIPYGLIEIKDSFSRILYKGSLNQSSSIILPESKRTFKYLIKPIDFSLPVSLNTISISGQDSLKQVTFTSQKRFLYLNPIFLGLLVLIISLVLIFKKRSKNHGR